MFFFYVQLRFHKVCSDLNKVHAFRTVFMDEILFLVIKFVLNKTDLLTQYKINHYFLLHFWINRKVGCLFHHCNTDQWHSTLFCNAINLKQLVVVTYGWRHSSVQCKKHTWSSPQTVRHSFHSILSLLTRTTMFWKVSKMQSYFPMRQFFFPFSRNIDKSVSTHRC